MATPPDFVAGNVLTAAQMNQIGLWLVKEQAVGSAVTTFSVTNCFTADFDAYRVVFSNIDGSNANAYLELQLVDSGGTAATTNYSQAGVYLTYASTVVNGINEPRWAMGFADVNAGMACDIFNPFLTTASYFSTVNADNTYSRMYNGKHTTAASYVSLKCNVSAGTATGGTVRVYGYRN